TSGSATRHLWLASKLLIGGTPSARCAHAGSVSRGIGARVRTSFTRTRALRQLDLSRSRNVGSDRAGDSSETLEARRAARQQVRGVVRAVLSRVFVRARALAR